MKIDIAALKAKFETGDIPTGQDFIDLIDTLDNGSSYCKVNRGVSQSIPNNVSPYPAIPIIMQNIENQSGEYSISNGGILCPTYGMYSVTGYAQWPASGSIGPQLVLLLNDGVAQSEYVNGVTYGDCVHITGVFCLQANCVVKFGVRSAASTISFATLSVFKV